jgi:membrane protease YdiL (CAAX protease family)
VLASVALATGHLLGGGVGVHLRLGRTRVGPVGMLAAAIGTAGLSLACGAAVDLLPFGRGTVMTAITSALRGTSPAGLVGAVVALGVAPGIAEEALFRGLVQTRLAERWGRWPAIVMASAAFGLMHLDLVQGTVAFAVGLFLGWIADRTGGIRPTIVAHAANNALFVLLAVFTVADTPPRATTSIALLATGLGAWVASVALLRSSPGIRPVHESAL